MLVSLLAAAAVLVLINKGAFSSGDRNATQPTPTPKPNSAITNENALPGTSDWQFARASNPTIQGYADHVSAQLGDKVALFVSAPSARTFFVEAYRMGWYGGKQGRLVWRSASTPAITQPSSVIDSATHTVTAPWAQSFTLVVDPSWPPGVYLLKLVGDDKSQGYVPLIVRDDSSHATYALQIAVNTWEAYNQWGGYSLYMGPDGKNTDRSTKVSFDRPYQGYRGAGFLVQFELPLVSFLEEQGLDITYLTDVDFSEHPEFALNHKALLVPAHDEYWSIPMRTAFETALAAGVNLAFLGANAVYWRVRYEASSLGPDRDVVGYKSFEADPLSSVDPAAATDKWRALPRALPEAALIGQQYNCANGAPADMVVKNTSTWVFSGSGLRDGDHIPRIVGPEVDSIAPSSPPNLDVLASSPITCIQGSPESPGQSAPISNMTYYSAASGSGVFSSGTIGWSCNLDPSPTVSPCGFAAPFMPTRSVRQITLNVLAAFGNGPACRVVRNYCSQ